MSADPSQGFLRFALRYGMRNLSRNKRRTVITIGTVMLSVAVTIIGLGYADAMINLWQEGSINHGTAHAQVHQNGYWEQKELFSDANLLVDDNEVEKRLRSDPAIDVVSRRLKFEGVISAFGKTIYFLGMGIEPGPENVVSPGIFNEGSDEGVFVESDKPEGIVIGKGMAEALDLRVGDEAVLLINTINGGVNAIDVQIVGTSDLPLPNLSKRLLYMHFAKAREALELGPKYTELAVRLKDSVETEQWVMMKQALANKFDVNIKGWWEIDPVIKDVERLTDSLIGLICFLLFISAGISVLNIVFMLVAERTVEIGTLMAIGAKTKDIQALFTIEAAVIGALGGILGVLVGNGVLLYMNLRGIVFENPFGAGTFLVHPELDLALTGTVFVGAIVICFIAALAPARKAASVEPVVAFRGQMT